MDAPGDVYGEQFVTWPQSQLQRGLSAGCSAFHLLPGGGGLSLAPLPAADAHLGHPWNRAGAWYQGMCACVPASSGSWAQLAELGLGWAHTHSGRCCHGLCCWSLSALPLCIHQKRPVHYMPTVLHGKHTTCLF